MGDILKGFGMKVLAFDPYPNDEYRGCGAEYVDLDFLAAESDIRPTLLTPQTDRTSTPNSRA